MITTKKEFSDALVLRRGGCLSFGDKMPPRYVLAETEHGTYTPVHRLAYFFHFGSIPKSRDVDHDCQNKWCANWKHLAAVTRAGRVRRDRARRLANPPAITIIAGWMDKHGLVAQDVADVADSHKSTAAGWRQGLGYPNDSAAARLRTKWPDFPKRP